MHFSRSSQCDCNSIDVNNKSSGDGMKAVMAMAGEAGWGGVGERPGEALAVSEGLRAKRAVAKGGRVLVRSRVSLQRKRGQ